MSEYLLGMLGHSLFFSLDMTRKPVAQKLLAVTLGASTESKVKIQKETLNCWIQPHLKLVIPGLFSYVSQLIFFMFKAYLSQTF